MIECIPKAYLYQCDVPNCGVTHVQKDAEHTYYNNTPEDWVTVWLKTSTTKRRFNEILLCPKHATVLDNFLEELK